MAGVTVSIKAPSAILLEHGLQNRGAVQSYIDREILRRSEPYVPRRSGALISSGYSATKIGSGSVTYSAPYAAYQYYGTTASGRAIKYNGAPMRGSYWFERMKAVEGNAILAEAAKIAGAQPSGPRSSNKALIPLHQPVKTVLGFRRTPVFGR